MIGRIGLQKQAGGSPGALDAEVVYTHPRSGDERLPIEQHFTNLFVTSRSPRAERFQPDHEPSLSELVVERVRVVEDLHRIRVDIDYGYTGSRSIASVATVDRRSNHVPSFPYLLSKTIPP
jgi:hypothetical protein